MVIIRHLPLALGPGGPDSQKQFMDVLCRELPPDSRVSDVPRDFISIISIIFHSFSHLLFESLFSRRFRPNDPKLCKIVPKVTILELILDDFCRLSGNPEKCVWTAQA